MDYLLTIITFLALYGILASSYNLVIGVAGLFGLAHAAFFGLGAYTSAILSAHYGVPFPVVFAAAMLVPAVASILIAGLSFRMSGDYLAITTLAFQMAFVAVVTNWHSLTGGAVGIFGIEPIRIAGADIASNGSYAMLAAVLCACSVWICRRLIISPFGRTMDAMRQDEPGIAMLGRNVNSTKVQVLAVACALAGGAGSIYAHYLTFISPESFTIHETIAILTMVIVGGAGNAYGPLVGAAIVLLIPEALTYLEFSSSTVFAVRQLLYAGLLVACVTFLPQGVLSIRHKRTVAGSGKLSATSVANQGFFGEQQRRGIREPSAEKLVFEQVTMRFGGLVSIESFSCDIDVDTKVTGIVGPNGAGKTTVFNVVTGFLKPTSGRIFYSGKDITGAQPHTLARLGVGRMFQDVKIFKDLNVLENVLCGIQGPRANWFWYSFFQSRSEGARDGQEGHDLLELVGLSSVWNTPAGDLAFGEQKLVALARALAAKPRLLMLDEPASGLDNASVDNFLQIIRRIARSGVKIIIVEHNLDVIRAICDDVIFMDQGHLVTRGTPSELFERPDLAERYFGAL